MVEDKGAVGGRRGVIAVVACAMLLMLLVVLSTAADDPDPIRSGAERNATAGGTPAAAQDTPIVVGQVPVGGDEDPLDLAAGWGRVHALPDGSRIVRITGGRATSLTEGFTAAGRPDVSFDGHRILFIARRAAGDPLNVWEMNEDGSGARQLTHMKTDCHEAIYLSTIYTIDAEEPLFQVGFTNVGVQGVVSLYTCRMDGSRVTRISYHPNGVDAPLLLSDGRLIFASLQAPAFVPTMALFTINTDGTDVSLFAPAMPGPRAYGMPCEISGDRVVYVEHAIDGMSLPVLVSVSRKRSLHSREVLPGMTATDAFGYPSPLDARHLLVSRRGAEDRSAALCRHDLETGAVTPIFDDGDWHEVGGVVLAPRRVPAGRASSVNPTVDFAIVYGLDAYSSDTKQVEAGAIRKLRIHRGDPDGERSALWSEVIGEIPVEPDGSFYFKLPPHIPIRLETLDADDLPLQTMTSWIWMMPKEQRGCIGCHEDRELTPYNRHVLALRKQPHSIAGNWRGSHGFEGAPTDLPEPTGKGK